MDLPNVNISFFHSGIIQLCKIVYDKYTSSILSKVGVSEMEYYAIKKTFLFP